MRTLGLRHMRCFDQGEFWLDKRGRCWLIAEMDWSYRRNTLLYLLRNVAVLHAAYFAVELPAIPDVETPAHRSVVARHNPEYWFEALPLVRALRASLTWSNE